MLLGRNATHECLLSQSVSQSVSQAVSQSASQPASQPASQSVSQCYQVLNAISDVSKKNVGK